MITEVKTGDKPIERGMVPVDPLMADEPTLLGALRRARLGLVYRDVRATSEETETAYSIRENSGDEDRGEEK